MNDPIASIWPSPLIITLIGGQVVIIITAIGQVILSILARGERASATLKIDSITGKVSAIEGHVNSEKTAAQGRELALQQKVDLLLDRLADEKVTKQLLAQAAANRSRIPESNGEPPSKSAVIVVSPRTDLVAEQTTGHSVAIPPVRDDESIPHVTAPVIVDAPTLDK